MADRATWARRVAEWKASGKSSPAFCEGKDFTPGGLRHMAHRLARGREGRERVRVRIARVLRLPRPLPAVAAGKAPESAAVVVEIGAARVVVPTGADRTTLATVFELLDPGASQ